MASNPLDEARAAALQEASRTPAYKKVRRVDPQELHNLWDDPAYAETRAQLTETLLREMFEAVDESPRARRRA